MIVGDLNIRLDRPVTVYNKKLSYRLETGASAMYFFVAKLLSIA